MTQKILNYLKLKEAAPTIEYLKELITAYCTNVPWESVSKIVKKELDGKKDNCIRLEEDFWDSSLKYGTGGTCYESNWAFYTFLQALGFEGYLTINKVVGKSSSYSAIVIKINGEKYIADIGYPLYGPVQIIENSVTLTNTYAYRSTAISQNEYIIENIDHPEPYLYHLIDIPVSPHNYLSVTCDDYGDTGLFSDRIIIRKIINH
jgi:arylamine N-acetyltransferase